jgi:hypothetical protein
MGYRGQANKTVIGISDYPKEPLIKPAPVPLIIPVYGTGSSPAQAAGMLKVDLSGVSLIIKL